MTASRVGRPRLTDPAQLLIAAREIGFESLTVGAVTHACGVRYSTFYRSYRSLDELLAALVDDVLTGVYVMAGGSWRTSLEATAEELAAYAWAWPGLAEAMQRLPERPWTAAARESMTASLVGAGLGEDLAHEGARAVLAAASLPPERFRPGHVGLLLDGLAARLGESVPS